MPILLPEVPEELFGLFGNFLSQHRSGRASAAAVAVAQDDVEDHDDVDPYHETAFAYSVDLRNLLNTNKYLYCVVKYRKFRILVCTQGYLRSVRNLCFRFSQVLETLSAQLVVRCNYTARVSFDPHNLPTALYRLEFEHCVVTIPPSVAALPSTSLPTPATATTTATTTPDYYYPAREVTFLGCKLVGAENLDWLRNVRSVVFSNTKRHVVWDLSPLANVHSFICDFREVAHYEVLSQAYRIGFQYCRSINSLDCFSQVRILCLRFCDHVCDLTPLKNLLAIELESCVGVVNVTPLQKVRRVEITGCENASDSSLQSLSDVTLLTIAYCPCLSSIPRFSPSTPTYALLELQIYAQPLITSLGKAGANQTCFEQLRKLKVIACPSISDLSVFKFAPVTYLDISFSHKIRDISKFRLLSFLRMDDCSSVTCFGSLHKLRSFHMACGLLTIDDWDTSEKLFCQQLLDIEVSQIDSEDEDAVYLAVNRDSLRSLTFSWSTLERISNVNHVCVLTLIHCAELTKLNAEFPNLVELTIDTCPKLVKIQPCIPHLTALSISDCDSLEHLKLFTAASIAEIAAVEEKVAADEEAKVSAQTEAKTMDSEETAAAEPAAVVVAVQANPMVVEDEVVVAEEVETDEEVSEYGDPVGGSHWTMYPVIRSVRLLRCASLAEIHVRRRIRVLTMTETPLNCLVHGHHLFVALIEARDLSQ
jgi:hypothetical protein